MRGRGISYRELAERLGAAPSSVNEWAGGKASPGRDFAIRLEDLSDGELPAEEWSPDPAVVEAGRANARRRARQARRQRSVNCTANTPAEVTPSESNQGGEAA